MSNPFFFIGNLPRIIPNPNPNPGQHYNLSNNSDTMYVPDLRPTTISPNAIMSPEGADTLFYDQLYPGKHYRRK